MTGSRGGARLPGSYRPQLATLVGSAPAGDRWLHEVKYDGYRIGCFIEGGQIRLVSRNGHDWTGNFGEIVEAAKLLGVKRALLDGEAAILLGDGRTSFQALQNAFSGGSRAGLVYFAFDLLHLEGEDLAPLPLEERKAALQSILARAGAQDRIRYADHVLDDGEAVLREACRLGLEGIVSKRRDEPYRPGRNDGWLKAKCIRRQEFVIGGFTDPEGSRAGIGALLVGVHRGGTLRFAGKVGTGFTQKLAAGLRRRLDAIEQGECPFDPRPAGPLGRRAHWVRPELVGEVTFSEWTTDGRIRHPSFQGLREDKRPAEVMAEEPSAPASNPAPPRSTGHRPPRNGGSGVAVAGVALSHPDRIVYPVAGFTKLDVAKYYESVGEWMLPHVGGRPLTLVRCPEGLAAACFYMKHSSARVPPALRRVRIPEKTKVGEYLVVDSVAGLISLVQIGILEIHTWNSRVGNIEQPDRIVVDIDPGPEVKPARVVEAARLARRVLNEFGLESYVKTTGGAGLHVVAPLEPAAGWDECLEFSRRVAQLMVRTDPTCYTTRFPKKGRERKILVDILRNSRASTSVAAFSTRAREGAPVSAPLTWEELRPGLLVRPFTMRSVVQRLKRLKGDPWAGYGLSRQQLPSI